MSKLQNQRVQDSAHSALPSIPEASTSPVGEWRPDIAYGSELWLPGEDLSRIEIANRRVLRARSRVEHYGSTPNPIFQQQLDEEIMKRAELDENDEENTKPM